MIVLKFGGSSLASPQRIASVVDIVRDAAASSRVAVVVSAMGGVTDALHEAARLAALGLDEHEKTVAALRERHGDAIRELARPSERAELEARLSRRLDELSDLLHGISLVRECSPRLLDQVSSYGERLSADVTAAALRSAGTEAEYADARRFVVTDKSFGSARVDAVATERAIREYFAAHELLQVVTGFLGATADGETTTLGRGGSDETAALVGAAVSMLAVVLSTWIAPEPFDWRELSTMRRAEEAS